MKKEIIEKAIEQLKTLDYKETVKEYERQEKNTHALAWVMANNQSGRIFVQQLTSVEHAEHEPLFPLYLPFDPPHSPETLNWVTGKHRFQEQVLESIEELKILLADREIIDQ